MIEPQKLVEYATSATVDVFSTMLGMEVEAESPRQDPDFPTINDGVMALVGHWWLSCSRRCLMISRVTGPDASTLATCAPGTSSSRAPGMRSAINSRSKERNWSPCSPNS